MAQALPGQCSSDFEGYSAHNLLFCFSFPITTFPTGKRTASRHKWMSSRCTVKSKGYGKIIFDWCWLYAYVPDMVPGTFTCMISFNLHKPMKKVQLNLFAKETTKEVSNSWEETWAWGRIHQYLLCSLHVLPQAKYESFHSKLLFQRVPVSWHSHDENSPWPWSTAS